MDTCHQPPPRFEKTSYTTTAIPYVNAQPHVGHAFEFVLADAIARYQRLCRERVWFLSGTDDNSLKNARAAEAAGLSTRALVARNAAAFGRLRGALDLSFDDYIQTSSDPRHLAGVAKLWRACHANGDIFRKRYRGLYCVGCEQFYREEELLDGRCPEHDTVPELVEEENYFFRLSKYQDQLIRLIDSKAIEILPEERRNEVLRFIERGLADFSISRSHERARGWGLPVPDDATQIIYVWFDALASYITALDYANDGAPFLQLWQQSARRTHVIGKDILRYHAVYWPAILLSAGIALPTRILAHGYITVDKKKIGKSSGNAIDPFALASAHGADALRVYLLRHLHSTKDCDFSSEKLTESHDVELADQLGNLLRRSLALIARHQEGIVAAPGALGDEENALIERAVATVAEVDAGFEAFALHQSVASIWRLVAAANRYADRTAPWTLARAQQHDPLAAERLRTVLYCLAESLRLIAVLITPIVPTTAANVFQQLGLSDGSRVTTWGVLPPGTRVAPGAVLFPKTRAPQASQAAPESVSLNEVGRSGPNHRRS
jgi:methionyl-tRNA synthetase